MAQAGIHTLRDVPGPLVPRNVGVEECEDPCIPVQATQGSIPLSNALQAIHHGNVKTCWKGKGHHCVWSDWMG